MTFSTSARPQQATGNKKHQMRVTHSALGLHAGQPPERSEGHRVVQLGWQPGIRQMVTPADENGVRATRWEPTGPRKREKALSMRALKLSVLLARGSTRPSAYTVEAEKGSHAYQLERGYRPA